ncbi:MAG: DUF3127 domain-containing protein [Winogradskyella sp.]
MEVKGKIKLIAETQTFDSGFTKRQLVVTTDEMYPQDVAIDFVKDKCDVLNAYKVGQSVQVGINIRGNEYNGKYYVSLQGWKIDKAEAVASTGNELQDDDLSFLD